MVKVQQVTNVNEYHQIEIHIYQRILDLIFKNCEDEESKQALFQIFSEYVNKEVNSVKFGSITDEGNRSNGSIQVIEGKRSCSDSDVKIIMEEDQSIFASKAKKHVHFDVQVDK